MGDLTTNFSRHEFACRGNSCCGHSAPINMNLVQADEHYRALCCVHVGHDLPQSPSSAFRCLVHNRDCGSHDTSGHPRANANDFPTPEGMSLIDQVRMALKVPEFKAGKIGIYDWGVHVEVECERVRFDKRREPKTFTWEDLEQ